MLGFIIFGWPKREKFVGSASPGFCEHCQNQTMWSHVKTRRWVSLFFVPVLPVSRASHWLVCDICGVSIEMDKEEARASKEMVENTQQRANGTLPEEEYYERVDAFATEFMDGSVDEEAIEADVSEVGEVQHAQ